MNRRELEKEGVDLKLIFLLLFKKIPVVIISSLIGALLCGGLYGIWHSRALGNRNYEARSQYYITFEEIEDENFFAFYYNGYTWNDLLHSDPILGYAMTLLPERYDRSYVDDCVKAEILSDVRVLTTTVTAPSAEEVVLFQDAVEQAVVHYAGVGEKLERIEVILSKEPGLENVANHMLRAAAVGAAGAALLAVLLLLFYIAVADAVYLPQEFEERFGIPCAGVDCGFLRAELAANEAQLCGGSRSSNNQDSSSQRGSQSEDRSGNRIGGEYPVLDMQRLLDGDEGVFHEIRERGGVILSFPQGKANGKLLARAIHNLKLQDCRIVCARITDADERLLKRYYGPSRRRGRCSKKGNDASSAGDRG